MLNLERGTQIYVDNVSYSVSEAYTSPGSADSMEGEGNDCYLELFLTDDFEQLYVKDGKWWCNNIKIDKSVRDQIWNEKRIDFYFNEWPKNKIEIISKLLDYRRSSVNASENKL